MAAAVRLNSNQPKAGTRIPALVGWRPTLVYGLASLAVAMLLILAERASLSGLDGVRQAFLVLGPIALAVLVLLAATTALALLLVPDSREAAPWEEAWLPPPRVPAIRGRAVLIGMSALEHGAGSSTLAFNLAVLMAAEGDCLVEADSRRRPRPLCLLTEGRLTESLGLDPKPLRLHLESRSGRVSDEVVELAWRHPSGAEFLCLSKGLVDRHRLRLLRLVVERFYDLIVLDGGVEDTWLQEAAEDVSDALLLVGLPTRVSLAAAARAAERAGMLHLLPRTALVLSRVRTSSVRHEDLEPFENTVFLPEDASVTAADDEALPFSLLPFSPAALQLRSLASQLLPDAFKKSGTDAA